MRLICIRNIAGILAIIMFLSGCAINQIAKQQSQRTIKTAPVPQGGALVAIRWPVAVDDAAQSILKENYISGGQSQHRDIYLALHLITLPGRFFGLADLLLDPFLYDDEVYKQIPENSTYYAMKAYRMLSKHLKPSEILLEPQILTAKNGQLHSIPLIEYKLPVAFVFDLAHFPSSFKGQPSVFVPIASVSAGANASPSTCGGVAALSHYHQLERSKNNECKQFSARKSSKPDLINHYYSINNKADHLTNIKTRNELPLTPNELMLIPQLYDYYDSSHYRYLQESASPNFDSSKNALKNEPLEFYARLIAEGVSQYDLTKSIDGSLIEYMVEYDQELATRYASGHPLSSEDLEKIDLVSQLADMEKQWINKQDKKLADNILDGSFGKSFRATRFALYQKGEARNQATMNLALSVTAINAQALSGHADTLTSTAMTIGSAAQYLTALSQMEHNFYSQFGAELDARDRVLEMNIKGRIKQIDAADRQALRKELKQIYSEFY